MKKVLSVARVLYANRKAEIAIVLAVASLIQQILQATTGH